MTKARFTNFKGEPVSCVQATKNGAVDFSANVPDGDVKKVKADCVKAYESEGYKVNVIPLYIG